MARLWGWRSQGLRGTDGLAEQGAEEQRSGSKTPDAIAASGSRAVSDFEHLISLLNAAARQYHH